MSASEAAHLEDAVAVKVIGRDTQLHPISGLKLLFNGGDGPRAYQQHPRLSTTKAERVKVSVEEASSSS